MTDESSNTQNTTPDAAENTGQENRQEHMIPKSRFDAVNQKMREYEQKLADLTQKQQERDQKEALDRGEHEKIINELRPKAERAALLEKEMEEDFKAEVLTVPEDFRDLIPEGDVSTRLKWVRNAKRRGIFAKPTPPITDAGAQGTPAMTPLSAEERDYARLAGMTDEQYAKYKKKD